MQDDVYVCILDEVYMCFCIRSTCMEGQTKINDSIGSMILFV